MNLIVRKMIVRISVSKNTKTIRQYNLKRGKVFYFYKLLFIYEKDKT